MERDVIALISQTVVSKSFERKLLASPEKALDEFQKNYVCDFTPEEIAAIRGIHATDQADFARQCMELGLVSGLNPQR